MKKSIFLFIAVLFAAQVAQAQVFNTGSTLNRGQFSLGINPVFWDDDLGVFLHGGFGIKSGIDFGVHYGMLDGQDYFGADLEWQFLSGKPSASLTTGAHTLNDFGLDLGVNLSFPLRSDADIYSGIDSDINFVTNDTQFLLWLPLGIELAIRRNMTIMLEAEIGLTTPAYHIFGGGVAFYF